MLRAIRMALSDVLRPFHVLIDNLESPFYKDQLIITVIVSDDFTHLIVVYLPLYLKISHAQFDSIGSFFFAIHIFVVIIIGCYIIGCPPYFATYTFCSDKYNLTLQVVKIKMSKKIFS